MAMKVSALLHYMAVALSVTALLPKPAEATASMLIWPIDPVVAPDRGGAALWLENQGKSEAVMQVRVMRWIQSAGEDAYEEQNTAIASPPVARIAPGARQLIRLVVPQGQRPDGEGAYRILIDEIPVAASNTGGAAESAMIKFRMRYSVPLFVYGKAFDKKSLPASAAPSALSCAVIRDGGERSVEVRNDGAVHARLTRVGFGSANGAVPLASGLLGYVLPGSATRWPLPKEAPDAGSLHASLDGTTTQVTIGSCGVQ